MNTMARNVLLIAALATNFACSSGNEQVDIGDGRTGERLEDYAAHWEGYAEAHDFSDGSDKVKLTLDATGHGTLQFGDSPALPPATDPNVGYPPGVKLYYSQMQNTFPGFSYPISPATVESARIRFSYSPWEIARDWCALQTSYPTGIDAYSCIPTQYGQTGVPGENSCRFLVGSMFTGDPVDCNKGWLCSNPNACKCDAAGCTLRETEGLSLKFDAALDDSGNSLVGTLVGVGTVRLKRVSND